MILVNPADPPEHFEERVRRPGLDAIAELVGEQPSRPRRGPKRTKVAVRREEIPTEVFPPLWRDVLPDMLQKYHRLCAYLALYIERATGSPSVDHVIPKSKTWDKIYEWSNYRLACGLINGKKNDVDLALDPFAITDELFALEFVEFQVICGVRAVGDIAVQVGDTIKKLGLNLKECCDARREYVEAYLTTGEFAGHDPIPLTYLERRAPFIARELRRQNMLRPGDT